MEDTVLINQIKSGKVELFDELIKKYYGNIYNYCYRHVNNKITAQDITQDVFVNVIKNINKYTHYGKFENYLYVIAGNLCKDFYKKKQPLYLDDTDLVADNNNKDISNVENKIFIEQALTQLSDVEHRVVILRYYHELKFKDIAKIMDSTVSVTKYRMKRAIEKLSEYMEV